MHGGGSASKLTAGALAGILAVGMVPAAAFAEDEAVEPVDEAAIELEVADMKTAFQSATVTVLDTVTGESKEIAAADSYTWTITQKAIGEKHAFKVTAVTVQGANGAETLKLTDDYTVNAYDASTNPSTALDPAGLTAGSGDIYIAAAAGSAYDGATALHVTVTLKAPTVTWSAFEATTGTDKDLKDTEIVYTGTNAKVGIAANGVIAFDGTALKDLSASASKGVATDFSNGYAVMYSLPGVDLTDANIASSINQTYGDEAADTENQNKVPTAKAGETKVDFGGKAPVDAGKYVAYLVKYGATGNSIEALVSFEIKPLDLSAAKGADLKSDHDTSANPLIGEVTINGEKIPSDALSALALTWVGAKDADGNEIASFKSTEATPGEYTYTLAPTAANNSNFAGAGTVVFNVADDSSATSVYYDETEVEAAGTLTTTIRIERGEKFDPALIAVYKGADDTAAAFAADDYTVKYIDTATKEEVTLDKINSEAGEYSVIVTIDAKKAGYKFGGETTFDIKVTGGEVAAGNIFFTYDGKTVDHVTVAYDGTDVLSKIKAVVKDKKGNVLPESDFTLEAKKGDDKITEIIDANAATVGATPAVKYTVQVKSDKYKLGTSAADATIEVIVEPATPAVGGVRVAGTTALYKTDGSGDVDYKYLPWTGEEITPTFEYTLATDPKAADAKWLPLPEGVYRVSNVAGDGNLNGAAGGENNGDKVIKNAGDYTLDVVAGLSTAAKNYDFSNATSIGLIVSKAKQFQDVPASAWFAGDVSKAAANGYMNGIGGTNFFAPYEKLTRAQAAQIIFNMAGGADKATIADGTVDKNKEYTTKFSDVDGSAWYAQPIQWASNAGIVSGYAGTDQFKPNQNVTRQEFAKMLYQLAQLKGEDVKTDGAKWDKISDKGTVASWATNYVKWAVDKGIMGSNGWVKGNSDIIRAEAAKMSTVAQPEKL